MYSKKTGKACTGAIRENSPEVANFKTGRRWRKHQPVWGLKKVLVRVPLQEGRNNQLATILNRGADCADTSYGRAKTARTPCRLYPKASS
jgi:hypothetical protein